MESLRTLTMEETRGERVKDIEKPLSEALERIFDAMADKVRSRR